MTDKEKLKDLAEQVASLRTVVKTLENEDLKNTLDFHLSRFSTQALKAVKKTTKTTEWDTFSYDKERCIAP
tara:strand:- start:1071 stop:1283 length:213 start_codon:yes stop_codon:yes gene_type:complete